MISMNKVKLAYALAIIVIMFSSISIAYAPSYMLYYKDIGILMPKGYDISPLSNFIELLRKYNVFNHNPRIINGISHKDDISDIDILIIGIYPDSEFINKSSIEVIGSWFDQGGKLIAFFNPVAVKYVDTYRKYNLLLDRLGSSIHIAAINNSRVIVSDILNPPDNNMREYTFEVGKNISCIYHVTGRYVIGSNIVYDKDIGNVHPLTYTNFDGLKQALSVIELVYVYSDLFTKVYSKLFLCMSNPLLRKWHDYDNDLLFVEVLSWGVSLHTELNKNGLMMISSLIVIGLSPYLYIIYNGRRKRGEKREPIPA